jgi:hypothetical protein
VEVQFILFVIEECAKKLHCKLSADLGNYIIMTGFKNAFSHLYLNIWLNLVAAVCFSVAAYFLNDSFIHSIAMAMLLIALYFAELFMEIKQDLPRRSLFGRPVYSPHFRVRIVQALLGALFWACAVYIMIWSDKIPAVLIGFAIYGIGTFLIGEREARRNKA